jgi:DNA-binding HxlR family transcriptional regulator
MMIDDPRSGCPIASTLDIVGDKWTLVILRDMLNGKARFGEFLDSPEHITTNILTDRLRMMEATGLVKRALYQPRPKRYQYVLTRRGRDLHPVLQEMCRWANQHMPQTWVPPEQFMAKSVVD